MNNATNNTMYKTLLIAPVVLVLYALFVCEPDPETANPAETHLDSACETRRCEPDPETANPAEYTVTFSINDDTTIVESIKTQEGSTVPRPKVGTHPVAPEYYFGAGDGTTSRFRHYITGWFTDEGFTKPYDFTLPVTDDLTLYAKYKRVVTPENKDALQSEINKLTEGNTGDYNYIDPYQVTDMSDLFKNNPTFNGDISKWDVSNVTNMKSMFSAASAFNQPLNDWDVSKVTSMEGMFVNAKAFNQPLNDWTVSKVKSMGAMFREAEVFNQPLNNWTVSKVVSMAQMFSNAKAFDQDLSGWKVSNVTSNVDFAKNAGFANSGKHPPFSN